MLRLIICDVQGWFLGRKWLIWLNREKRSSPLSIAGSWHWDKKVKSRASEVLGKGELESPGGKTELSGIRGYMWSVCVQRELNWGIPLGVWRIPRALSVKKVKEGLQRIPKVPGGRTELGHQVQAKYSLGSEVWGCMQGFCLYGLSSGCVPFPCNQETHPGALGLWNKDLDLSQHRAPRDQEVWAARFLPLMYWQESPLSEVECSTGRLLFYLLVSCLWNGCTKVTTLHLQTMGQAVLLEQWLGVTERWGRLTELGQHNSCPSLPDL